MKCDNPISIKLKPELSAKHGMNHAPVQCGKCYNCKQTRIAQWSFRLLKELEVADNAYFVTLTYDNQHVPITTGRYPMTLLKNSKQDLECRIREGLEERSDRSLQGFFKRLRYYERETKILFDYKVQKIYEKKPIKYYAAGEYGSKGERGGKGGRPHYHIILFNIVSATSIAKAWATAVVEKGITVDFVPFGSINIQCTVNSNNIEYTVKYICKEGRAGTGKLDNRVPEFSLMSKGLGKNFITDQIESFYNRRLDINFVVNEKGHKIPMPKYYVNKMMTDETKEDRVGIIKRQVEEAEAKDRTTAMRKQQNKFGRQALMKNYGNRNAI